MAATSDEEMDLLLSNFDKIFQVTLAIFSFHFVVTVRMSRTRGKN